MHLLHTDTLGKVRTFPFASSRDGEGEGVAVIVGRPEDVRDDQPAPLLRVHSRCLYGEVLGSLDCDCLPQYQEAVRRIGQEGAGVVCYLEQEGRGQGLIHKARAYEYMQEHDLDTVEAYNRLDYEIDRRRYAHVGGFLRELGITRVRLLTNNPRKVSALEDAGIRVERVAVIVGINHWNAGYIATKRNKLGHLIDVALPGHPVPVAEAGSWG